MCGFLVCIKKTSLDFPDFEFSKLNLKRRGPDFQDELLIEDSYFFHSRLAIIDLDERSHQPLKSKCGRYIIVFNGEIYNYLELSEFLNSNNVYLKTTSDTEVLLELFLLLGEDMLPKLRGMFSFFVWDKIDQTGFAARDAYGIKPLYFYHSNDYLIYSSQVKAIFETGLINNDFSKQALFEFYLQGNITNDCTIFDEIKCFKPGYLMRISKLKIIEFKSWIHVENFWNEKIDQNLHSLNKNDLQILVHKQILESVKYHTQADVKIGIFLSSGIDSSTIASLLKESGTQNFQGICVIFDGQNHDELLGAEVVAEKYEIPLYVKFVSKQEFLSDINEIFSAMDQPSIDGINTWYASKAASECGIKVVLSGVGADELFYGYKYYSYLPSILNITKTFFSVRFILNQTQKIFELIGHFTGAKKWALIPKWLQNNESAWLLQRSFLLPKEIIDLLNKSDLNNFNPRTWVKDKLNFDLKSPYYVLSLLDSFFYLRHQLLRDTDWASMYHGVEVRTPFVDVFLTKSLSSHFSKFKDFPKKKLLYVKLKFPLPAEVLKRKKSGFMFPIKQWMTDQFFIHNKIDLANVILSKYSDSIKK